MSGRAPCRGSSSAPGRRRREYGGTSSPRGPGYQHGAPGGRSTTPAPRPGANPARRQGDRPTGRFQRSRAAARARAPRSCAASAPPARRQAAHSRAVGATGFHGRRPSAGRRWNRSDQARGPVPTSRCPPRPTWPRCRSPWRLPACRSSCRSRRPWQRASGRPTGGLSCPARSRGPQPAPPRAGAPAPAGRALAAYADRRKRDNSARSRSHSVEVPPQFPAQPCDTHCHQSHPATQSVRGASTGRALICAIALAGSVKGTLELRHDRQRAPCPRRRLALATPYRFQMFDAPVAQ